MKIILVCGDRHWRDRGLIETEITALQNELDLDNDEIVIVEGEADGADKMARQYAVSVGISVRPHPALWGRYGHAAGPIRNQEMLDTEHPDMVLAFHDHIAYSSGTADMIDKAQRAGIPVRLISHLGRTTL